MQFLREKKETAVQVVADRLIQSLKEGNRVLWLVCGGSNITAEVQIMDEVRMQATNKLGSLAILPTDERYGKPGHPDSNYQQLKEAGFNPGSAVWVDVLMYDVPLDQTVSFYSDIAATAFAKATQIIAVFGMGQNAHIAGLQPGSPAIEPDEASVVGYEWEDFTRLTLTASIFKQLNVAYALVYGDKQKALERLQRNEESFEHVPAILLHKLPEAYIYNDFIRSEEQ